MKLVKLHLEISPKLEYPMLFYYDLINKISVRYYNRLTADIQYPIALTELIAMFKCYEQGDTSYIGIIPDKLNRHYYELYKKILDVEYGVSGREVRVIRKVLEDCIIYYNEVDKGER